MTHINEDPLDPWLQALRFTEVGQELFINRGGRSWYANIRHQKGYVVWYMPGRSPEHALSELVRALTERGVPQRDITGDFRPAGNQWTNRAEYAQYEGRADK